MIKVRNEVTVYETNGKETQGLERPILIVSSHWNWDDRVDLTIGGDRITVLARDLEAAVKNATNTRRHF